MPFNRPKPEHFIKATGELVSFIEYKMHNAEMHIGHRFSFWALLCHFSFAFLLINS